MGEFLDAFPPHLRDRLITYAQDPSNFNDDITLDELEKLPLHISDEQWVKVRNLIGISEANSLDQNYEPTEKTNEVAEVEAFFTDIWPIPS